MVALDMHVQKYLSVGDMTVKCDIEVLYLIPLLLKYPDKSIPLTTCLYQIHDNLLANTMYYILQFPSSGG